MMMRAMTARHAMVRGCGHGEGHNRTVQQAHESEHDGECRVEQAIDGPVLAHDGTCKWNLVALPSSKRLMDKILDWAFGDARGRAR